MGTRRSKLTTVPCLAFQRCDLIVCSVPSLRTLSLTAACRLAYETFVGSGSEQLRGVQTGTMCSWMFVGVLRVFRRRDRARPPASPALRSCRSSRCAVPRLSVLARFFQEYD